MGLLGALPLALSACAVDPLTTPSPFRSELVAAERRVTHGRYATPVDSELTAPDGAFVLGHQLYVWSAQSTRVGRISLRGETYGRRLTDLRVPGGVRRCQEGPGRALWCLTDGGQVVEVSRPGVAVPPSPQALPATPSSPAFYNDFLVDRANQRTWVFDAVSEELRAFSFDGVLEDHTPMANVYALGDAGDYVFALRWTNPRLVLVAKRGRSPGIGGLHQKAHGHREAIEVMLSAPIRAAIYAPKQRILWTVGPEQAKVRRNGGPLRNLRTHVMALSVPYRATAGPDQHTPSITTQVDLGALEVVDGVDIALVRDGSPIVAAAGSDVLWTRQRRVPTGAQPVAVTPIPERLGGGMAWVNRLDHSVTLARNSGATQTIQFARPDLSDPATIGERLYYSAKLWKTRPADAYTCNTCHWDTGSDHRRHPGFLERRWEITRPLDGIGVVTPIFTTGGAETLADALEGLVRGLDRRMWDDTGHGQWWLDSRTLRGPEGEVTLTARDVRHALLAFLVKIPVRRPALDIRQQQRGWEVFEARCVGCHEPSTSMRTRQTVPESTVLSADRPPLTFGNPGWAKAGQEPYYTHYGNRISPLFHLARGGPFFSNGQARTLDDVLKSGHGLPGTPPLSADDSRALRRFLLAL